MKICPVLMAGILVSSCLDAAPVTFWSQSGAHASVDGALDGASVADRLGVNSYNGYLGQLALIPTDPAMLGDVPVGTSGMITADSGGLFSGYRGLAGFCIDSETMFNVSGSQTQIWTYNSYTFAAANERYLNEGVSYYEDGGLKRAAYLMDRFFSEAHAGGENEAAALQAAIWETLYDSNTSVSEGGGDYYIRTSVGNGGERSKARDIRDLANGWLDRAAEADWGGGNYDPENRVIFWLDPSATDSNQSIITLNPENSIQAIPEPHQWAILAGSVGLMFLIRRRS